MTNKNLNILSEPEALWLWRIRQPSMLPVIRRGRRRGEMTMAEAAKFLGLSTDKYASLEAGRRVNLSVEELPSFAFLHVPRPEISIREQLLLARKRSGISLRQMSREIGLSHTRILTLEGICDRRLVAYWEEKGYSGFAHPEDAPEPVYSSVRTGVGGGGYTDLGAR